MSVAIQHVAPWTPGKGLGDKPASVVLHVSFPELVTALASWHTGDATAGLAADGTVAVMNRAAFQAGVRLGASRDDVFRRGVRVRSTDAVDAVDAVDAAEARLRSWLSPLDAVVAVLGAHAIAIELSGPAGVHTPHRAAQRIRALLAQRFVGPIAIGIGPNRLVAEMAARRADDAIESVRADAFLATFGSEPVQALIGVSSATSRRLAGLGVFTIAQLARVRVDRLKAVFGAVGHVLLARARGMDVTPVVSHSVSSVVPRRWSTSSNEDAVGFLPTSPPSTRSGASSRRLSAARPRLTLCAPCETGGRRISPE